jgi:O-antigen/teichoic acid export membrane protein
VGTVITIGVLCVIGWWLVKGRQSTGAIISNLLIVLVFGGAGVLLLVTGSGMAVLVGIGCLLYALYGVYQTVPWIRERMDPDGK